MLTDSVKAHCTSLAGCKQTQKLTGQSSSTLDKNSLLTITLQCKLHGS